MWGDAGCQSCSHLGAAIAPRADQPGGLLLQAPDLESPAGLRGCCCLPSMPVLSPPGAAAAGRAHKPQLAGESSSRDPGCRRQPLAAWWQAFRGCSLSKDWAALGLPVGALTTSSTCGCLELALSRWHLGRCLLAASLQNRDMLSWGPAWVRRFLSSCPPCILLAPDAFSVAITCQLTCAEACHGCCPSS